MNHDLSLILFALGAIIALASAVLGVSVEALAALTWENGQRCFKELMT